MLSLFTTGQIPPVDAAALSYIPTTIIEQFGLSLNKLIIEGMDNRPLFNMVLELPWGRIAVIMLPCLESELYQNQTDLVKFIIESLHLSHNIGAQTVSLYWSEIKRVH